ncbi:MAG: motility protein A [Defluviitaleaceae bacterium]|nr:motility protein A [Defluviitaleaceae bacterium]
MELGSIIGFLSGIVFILLSIFITAEWQIGDAMAFVSAASAMIVFGGTIASTFIGFKFEKLLTALKAYGVVFKPPSLDPAGAIEQIVSLANTARKEGVLALEESTNSMDDQFLKKGINLIVDGTDPELVKGIMETELAYIEERHGEVAAVYEFMAQQAPAWGMVGTMVGLILMLLKLDDPENLGINMSVALITTFYGSLVANLLAGPVGNKMKQISKEEVLLKTVLIEGMLSIQAGENPRIIEEKLKSFLSPALRDDVSAGGGRKAEEAE